MPWLNAFFHMTVLLIDNSNTRTKFMRAEGETLLPEQRVLPTAELSAPAISSLLSDWNYERVVASSVVPDAKPKIEAGVRQDIHWLGVNSPLSFSLRHYEGRATLGADRLANAEALCAYSRFPSIAVDLGTAVTYDVLGSRGGELCFLGGVIAPGWAGLSSILSRTTAQLPQTQLQESSLALAQNTQDALLAGYHWGFLGMVKETLLALRRELSEEPFIVLTGGDAPFVMAKYGEGVIEDKYLTMKGLLRVSLRLC